MNNPNNKILAIRLADKVIAVDDPFVKIWDIRIEHHASTLSIKEPINPYGIGFHWILNSNAQLILLEEISRKPYAPLPLKKIINWTRIHYKMSEPMSITLGEMLDLFKGTKSYFKQHVVSARDTHGSHHPLTSTILVSDIIERQITYD